MTEVEAIRARHSVRAYLPKPIEPEKAEKLEAFLETCNRESGLHLQLLRDAGGTFDRLLSKAMGLNSAPSVIACVGPDGADLEERIGYYGEKAVLYAQQLGLNTCWAGTFQAKNVPAVIQSGERLVIVIAIGYGATQGKAHRSKAIEEVTNVQGEMPQWFRKGVELALLAPTAINQQKFRFCLDAEGKVTVLDQKGPFSKVDLGIVKCHFEIGRREV